MSVPFPEAPPELIAPDVRQVIYSHLPTYEDARGACELFLNCSSYMCAFQFYSAHYLCLLTIGAVQNLVLDEGRDITHPRNCVSKQVRANPFLFPDMLRLLRFLAGGLILNQPHIISACSLLCLPCRGCFMAKTTIQWNHRTTSCCLA